MTDLTVHAGRYRAEIDLGSGDVEVSRRRLLWWRPIWSGKLTDDGFLAGGGRLPPGERYNIGVHVRAALLERSRELARRRAANEMQQAETRRWLSPGGSA